MAFSEGGLNCEDTFRRILYYTERRKNQRSIPTLTLSSSSSASVSASQPWYHLPNPEAHQSFRQQQWPPPRSTQHIRDSHDEEWGNRPWVMPLASSMNPSTTNQSLLAVRNARSLGDLSQNVTLLPPITSTILHENQQTQSQSQHQQNNTKHNQHGDSNQEPNQNQNQEQTGQQTPETIDDLDDALETRDHILHGEKHDDTNIDHVPENFFTTKPTQESIDDIRSEQEQQNYEQDKGMIFFDDNGLPTTSKMIRNTSDIPLVQFERAPRRPHLYALMDLSHEAHRIRLHQKWNLIKNAFVQRPPQGMSVGELIPMLLNECQVPLSQDQLISLTRQLPNEFHQQHSLITYYDFLEYFGELQSDGTIVEPLVTSIQIEKQKNHVAVMSETGTSSPFDGELAQHDLSRTDNGHTGHTGHLSTLPKHHLDSEENIVKEEGKGIETTEDAEEIDISNNTSRNSTRIAMEWDAYKAEQNITDGANGTGSTNRTPGMNDINSTHSDINLTRISLRDKQELNDHEDEDAIDVVRNHINLSIQEIQMLSCILIQSNMRGYLARKGTRLRRALALCMRHELATLRTVVRTWHQYTAKKWKLKKTCSRVLHQWKRYVQRLHRHRYIFQHLFWIFYIWRKDTASKIYSRNKIKNLIDIYNTTVLLRTYRIWKLNVLHKIKHDKLNEERIQKMNKWRQRNVIMNIWHPWSSNKAKLLKKWRERGSHLAAQNQLASRLTWFAMWRYSTYLSAVVKERSGMYW